MMRRAIEQFHTQFSFQPEIIHREKLPTLPSYLLSGMGGSHLAADVLKMYAPELDFQIFNGYGLPVAARTTNDTSLYIASSYSGNTEETLSFFDEAVAGGNDVAVISVGGKLIERAKKHAVPYVVLPDTGIQPRMALGYVLRALTALMNETKLFEELGETGEQINPKILEQEGKGLAKSMEGKVPIIYASDRNATLAVLWKIKMNETGKTPAFANSFPELNHNEMTSFDWVEKNEALSKHFHFVFLSDSDDDPRVQRRMEVTEELYQKRGLSVTTLWMQGASRLEKLLQALVLGDWVALHTAEAYGAESEQVPMVEDFKTLLG